jgi:hypothetical protein
MSSVLRFSKQIPSDSQYFISLANNVTFQIWVPDSLAPLKTYQSGQVAGHFQPSTITGILTTSTPTLFRDMGSVIVSSSRTFRRVQMLSSGGNEYLNNTFTPNNEGVIGTIAPSPIQDSSYRCYYFETGARGQGYATPLIRYG